MSNNTGVFYAPYIPLQISRANENEDEQPTIRFVTPMPFPNPHLNRSSRFASVIKKERKVLYNKKNKRKIKIIGKL